MKPWTAIRTLVQRVSLITTEGGALQRMHVRIRKGLDDVLPYLEPYGFTARPLAGAEALLLKVGADGAGSIVLVVFDRRYRLAMEKGEVAIYDDQGQKVHIKRDRIVVDGTNIELGEGAVEKLVKGTAFMAAFNTHKHPDPVSGETGPPSALMTAEAHLSDRVSTL